MIQLKCDNISLGYDGKAIVENLSLCVSSGDYLCVVGENGSGKSTLIRTLLGLQKPVSGKVEFGDEMKQTEIGYLPQQTDVQKDFPASVWEIVLSGCQNKCGIRPFYRKEEKARAIDAMMRLNIMNLSKRCYRELSGGQQQRVLLARALCATEKILLLDEPVTGLDPKASLDFYDMIYKLNRDDGITVIMVSHDISSTLEYATHILHVGHKLFFGTKEEYLQSDAYRHITGGRDINA